MKGKAFIATCVGIACLGIGACNLIGGIEPAEPLCPVDGVRNGRETDVDCGGPCATCSDFLACTSDDDCANHVCEEGMCLPALCYDGRQNGFESDVDCGGSDDRCPRCAGGESCRQNEDCAASAGDPAACENGVCHSLCCFFDCEGCSDCQDVCPAGSLGSSCDAIDCLEPLSCFEEDNGTYLCF